MQGAAIKAMIKCVHLNMSQLYICISEWSNYKSYLDFSYLHFKVPREKLEECYITVSQTETEDRSDLSLDLVILEHTMSALTWTSATGL